MRPVVWLRVAAVLVLIHAVLHTIGGVFGAVPPGPASVAVTAMKENTFDAFGQLRSFWMFYRGMGLAGTLSMTLEAVVLWQLADLAKTAGARVRPIVLAFAVSFVVFAALSWQYFFMAPVITELLIAACLVVAAVGLGKKVERSAGQLVGG